MNTLKKTILMAVATSAAATALSSQGPDQSAFFEQQRMLTDGYTAPFTVGPTKRSMTPATPYQIAEPNWLTAELARGPGRLPTPFPVPGTTVAAKAQPTTLSQVAQNKWQHERDEDDGYASPSQFPN